MKNIFTKSIPQKWETKRLLLLKAEITEAKELQTVYEDGFKNEWTYKEKTPIKNYMHKRVVEPTIPPEGSADLYNFLSIKLKETSEIIGYFSVYFGHPNNNTLFINELFIISKEQKKGLGREIIDEIKKSIKEGQQFTHIRCKARLQNLPAIKFWKNNDFLEVMTNDEEVVLEMKI